VTRNANSVKNALEKFPINFDETGETNGWGEEADTVRERSNKRIALTSMSYRQQRL
jgi:hypothetical protein